MANKYYSVSFKKDEAVDNFYSINFDGINSLDVVNIVEALESHSMCKDIVGSLKSAIMERAKHLL